MDGAQLFGAIGSSFMMATILVVRARTALATATATMTTVKHHLLADPGTPGTLRVRCRVCVSAEKLAIAVVF